MGRLAKEYFDFIGIKVTTVVDKNATDLRNDSFWQDVNVVHPKEISSSDKNSAILAVAVCTVPYASLQDSLLNQGWHDIVPFYDIAEAYRDIHPLSNGWFTGPLAVNDISAIEEVLAGWVDNSSRAHHLQFLAWHSLREEWYFNDAPVTTNDRYFIPAIRLILSDNESFLDVGAHHGEVSLAFLQHVGNRFRTLWLVEPDSANATELRVRCAALMPPHCRQRIEIFECAVGASCGERKFFSGLGYASQLCNFGQQTAELATIDALNLTPSFIKLHLEGWELEALKGAVLTINRTRPILTITAYHNRLGLWQLPKWLMEHLVDYKFRFQLHSWCGTGAVIYAIPAERYK
jgi:FkbM family methyltransferase